MMSLQRLCLTIGLALLVVSAYILIWGFWPRSLTMDEISVSPGSLPSGMSVSSFLIKLAWTERVRAGDVGLIRLNLEGKDLDQRYHWIVEARLELAGVRARPGEDFQSPLLERQPVSFFWNLNSAETGTYPGKVWIYLQPIAVNPEQPGTPGRSAVAAMPIEVRVSRLVWLDGSAARVLGMVGVAGGLLLFLPSVLPVGKSLLNGSPVKR